jgi:formyltetrahydrofolate deformylase
MSKEVDITNLLIDCPDQKGIVHAVSSFVVECQGNIIDSQQYSLGLDAHFFMRLCIKFPQMQDRKALAAELTEQFQDIATRYKMNFKFTCHRKRMAVLVSKYDHCLYDILLRQQYGDIDVDIPVIISNHADLKHVAENFKIDFVHLPIPEPSAKRKQEEQIIAVLKKYDVDFIALARYMQIISSSFIDAYPFRIINVHHGFLPAFKGAKPYHQAYEKGVKIIGATAHYATEDLDMGPIVHQGVIEVGHRDKVEDYISKGRDIEKVVFAKAVKAHAEDKVIVYEGRTIVFD